MSFDLVLKFFFFKKKKKRKNKRINGKLDCKIVLDLQPFDFKN